jgi:hypothetical protein
MDISPADSPATSSADTVGGPEHQEAGDFEVDAFLAAERTANDYHP